MSCLRAFQVKRRFVLDTKGCRPTFRVMDKLRTGIDRGAFTSGAIGLKAGSSESKVKAFQVS